MEGTKAVYRHSGSATNPGRSVSLRPLTANLSTLLTLREILSALSTRENELDCAENVARDERGEVWDGAHKLHLLTFACFALT